MINPLLKILKLYITPYQLNVAGATIVGGMMASRSARKASSAAAAAQQAGVDTATGEQRRQFDISQSQSEPFRQAGLSAMEQQLALLGLGGREAVEGREAIAGQAAIQGRAATPLRFRLGKGFIKGSDAVEGRPAIAAQEAVQAQAAVSAEEAQRQAFQQFNDSPGQAFLRDRGEQAILRNSAATGGLGGARVQEALQQQGIGFAQQDLQNQLARLAGISGQGQVATQNVAQLGAQTAGNIGNLAMQGGQAQAGGILGAGAAQSRFFGQAGGALAGSMASQPPAGQAPAGQAPAFGSGQVTSQPSIFNKF